MDAYLGEIRLFAGNYAPVDWALCDGSKLPVNEYQALFSLLGTTYGGNGINDFGLPDLRGRAPVGIGTGTGLTPRPLASQWGSELATLDSSTLPAHNHPFTVSTAAATNIAPNGALLGAATTLINNVSQPVQYFDDGNPTPTPVQMNNQAMTSAGGSQPHDNQQPYIVINYIICVVGTYPQRA